MLELCERADMVFLALHGAIGENGQLQAVLDTLGVPYTGTGYAGSLLAMDKNISKRLMREVGILTPRWSLVELTAPGPRLPEGLSLPCVVKPCGCGSSVGVSIVESLEQYQAGLTEEVCPAPLTPAQTALLPQEALAAGISYHQLCEMITSGRTFKKGPSAGNIPL